MPKHGNDPFSQEATGLMPPSAEIVEEMRRRLAWKLRRPEGSFRDPELHKKLAH